MVNEALKHYLEPYGQNSKFRLKFVDEAEKRRVEFMSHVSPECVARLREDRPITFEEWQNLRGNSYEFKLYRLIVDNETLLHILAHYYDNCFFQRTNLYDIELVYNDALIAEVLPELVKRIKCGDFKEGN